MSFKNFLSPKNLIIDAMVSKFEANGIKINSALCVFDIEDETFKITIDTETGEQSFFAEEKELSMIKKLFVNKVLKQHASPDYSIEKVIINIEIENKNISVFLDTNKNGEQTLINI